MVNENIEPASMVIEVDNRTGGGCRLVWGLDFGMSSSKTIIAVIGSLPQATRSALYVMDSASVSASIPEPTLDPRDYEYEPPPRKKSWRQQQRELPKFLR